MYILTRAEPLENCKDNICRIQVDAEEERQYIEAGYRKYERSYQLKSQHKEYIVFCPEFRKRGKVAGSVVLIPEFLVPGRPYPVYIYAYAIGLYTNMPEKGQRWAAAETRKQFGLQSFAHTTLGRALKSFVRRPEVETAAVVEDPGAAAPDSCEDTVFPQVSQTEASRKQAALLLSGVPLCEGKHQIVISVLGLARELFVKYHRFLL